MDKKKILIAEDDVAIQDLIDLYLDKAKYETVFAMDGEEAVSKFRSEKPDLVILDIKMPRKSGFEVCIEIRKTSFVPIIIISSRNADHDVVEGLMLGADDYVTKPFNILILLARIEANLRFRKEEPRQEVFRVANLEIDYNKHELRRNGELVELHPRELLLLMYLAERRNQVISLDQLYREVWGADPLGDTLTVSVHISRIRKKIETNPKEPQLIKTVKGRGYMLVEET